jgi:hypothetical protein
MSGHDDTPWGRVTGGLSLGGSTFQDASTAAIDVEERFVRYEVAVYEIGGRDLQARLRGSSRRGTRTVAGLARLQDARDPLYEASLTWAPAGGRFTAAAGRLGAYPFVSLGYLDGVLGAVRPTGRTELGAFAGRQAGGRPLGLSGSKAGAFVRLRPRTGPVAFDLVATGVREERGGAPSRELLGQEAHARSGKLTLYERVEIDLFRGERQERAGTAAQLTEARLLASWQATASRFVTLSYERRRNTWDAATRDLPVSVFDDRLHETLRANVHVARIGGAGLWLGGSARRREADPRTSFSADAGFRTGGVWGMTLSADGSFYQTQYTLGAQATGMLTRDFAGGHRLDVSYTFTRYDIEGPLAFRNNHWARASGYVRLPQRAFLRADLEHGLGDDLKGTRAGLEAGVRF